MRVLERVAGLGAGVTGILSLLFILSSCASMQLPSMPSFSSKSSNSSKKPGNHPTYEVMTQGAPFYLGKSPERIGGGKSYPFLYLSKGTTVTLLESGKSYGEVSLGNGTKGLVPMSAIAPQMAPSEVPPSGVTPFPAGAHVKPPSGSFNPEAGVKLPAY